MAIFFHFICLKSVENIHFYVFLRQETDSTGSNYPIKIILWIFGIIASIKLLLKQTISSLFFVHWPKTHISTMDDTTPSTSQKKLGRTSHNFATNNREPQCSHGAYKCGYNIFWYVQLTSCFDKFHYLSNILSQLCYCIVV